eukprot:scaffold349_cov157-Skeletonema_dohrnii-CCMP3373.AAC.13
MKQHNVPHDESRRRRYKQHRSSPDHLCFGKDEIGNLTHDCIVERLNVMLWKENTIYNYDRFATTTPASAGAAASDAAAIATPQYDPMRKVNPDWRAQITTWSYSVVDHFHMSRECVAVSMNLFDRYFAHEKEDASKNKNAVLLVSCATLSIAIKLMEVNDLSLKALSRFSRGKYTPSQIFDMEWLIVASLDYYLNPPTVISFVMHLILLLPHEINERDRNELVEYITFAVELSVADSFFVGNKPAPSIIAAAAIIVSLQQCGTLSQSFLSTIIEIQYCDIILEQIGIDASDSRLKESRHRLQLLLKNNKRE